MGLRQCGATGSSPLAQGQVEKNVRDARHRMWQVAPVFPDLVALNDWLEERGKQLWTETPHGTLQGSIADVWEAEKPALMPLTTMFDGFVEVRKRVSPTCLITFDGEEDQQTIRGIVCPTQGYSVPARFANRPVSLRIYPERLVVVAEGHVVCTHERVVDRSHRKPGRFIYDWRHYLAVVQRKPGALEAGVPTKTHVLNLLHRLVDGAPIDQPDVTPPAALALSKEPEANVARYDGLRPQKGTRHAS